MFALDTRNPGKVCDSGNVRLLAPLSRGFVSWATAVAASDGVLDRNKFVPEDLKVWFGHLAVIMKDAEVNTYRYRLFGSNLRCLLGGDHTGSNIETAWHPKAAGAIRDRLNAVLAQGIPVVTHSVRCSCLCGETSCRHSVLEEVMWPLRYDINAPDAVLACIVEAPIDTILSGVAEIELEGQIEWCPGSIVHALNALARGDRQRDHRLSARGAAANLEPRHICPPRRPV